MNHDFRRTQNYTDFSRDPLKGLMLRSFEGHVGIAFVEKETEVTGHETRLLLDLVKMEEQEGQLSLKRVGARVSIESLPEGAVLVPLQDRSCNRLT